MQNSCMYLKFLFKLLNVLNHTGFTPDFLILYDISNLCGFSKSSIRMVLPVQNLISFSYFL